ncbi:homoserine acetyltransferase [Suhomyces tanzawaensis NRRL Y-17324]|uniref:Homoserine acetyltransferase n=1 Tax=Suhomyces tanzawaensis NRRL Y-17324 TaxID=984487 RepID=A0A1E4SLN4_9ASCO|nr:homoserine acetyltransferase [Suhomyces tanzawaensis NRRL Y-17324]ODV80431.1 homoserine acetyltransferase [Suhomyces tanzawaensis NRRL Y-17324]
MFLTLVKLPRVVPNRISVLTKAIASFRSASHRATAAKSPKHTSSNPPLAFPCLDKVEKKNEALSQSCSPSVSAINSLEGGPEPSYSMVMTGFKIFKSKKPIFLDFGGFLPEYEIAYETWGKLNEDKSNLILIHTGLSASSHAKSQPDNLKNGWWEEFIGSGKYIDTDKYFVVCTNVLGGCYGSTGPSSKDPANNDYYGTRFPILSVNDMVRAQREFIRGEFGVKKIYASVGASMGGMQSLAYAWEFPDEVDKIISISGCARSHPYSIALRHTQRQVLMSDANWNRGFYYEKVPPHVGMKLAREIATVTYRSGPEWEYRFGRNRADELKPPALCPDFLVETYLDHAGEKFCLEYDANSFLYILKAMDLFDLRHSNYEKSKSNRKSAQEKYNAAESIEEDLSIPEKPYQEQVRKATVTPEESYQDLRKGMERLANNDVLVVGVESDILFPVWQQREIAKVLGEAKEDIKGKGKIEYFELGNDVSNYGHDTFLLSLKDIGGPVKQFLG